MKEIINLREENEKLIIKKKKSGDEGQNKNFVQSISLAVKRRQESGYISQKVKRKYLK